MSNPENKTLSFKPEKKILFLCSSLEPGFDGIGDYTLRLANVCNKQLIKVALIALSDQYIDKPVHEINDYPRLRLPKFLSKSEKKKIIIKFVADFRPDIISIQFMPYSLNTRGIVFSAMPFIKKIVGIIPIHIMLHELWIGEERGSKIKDKIIGWVQRKSILSFINNLSPILIHASIDLNIQILQQYGIKAKLLPLFGNIPIHVEKQEDWIYNELNKADPRFSYSTRESFVIFGIFGSLYENWNFESLLKKLRSEKSLANKIIIIASIGNLGSGKIMWNALVNKNNDFTFVEFGRRDPNEISDFLQFIDYGIATTPTILLGKSGSFLAMKEHGLPVFSDENRFEFKFKLQNQNFNQEQLIIVTEKPVNFNAINKKHPSSQLESIAQQFINDLEEINSKDI